MQLGSISVAIGLALCSAIPAQAQSGLSISGSLDIGAFRDFDGSKNIGSMSRSNIAFEGSEEIGDDLSVNFRLSHRLNIDNGTSEDAGLKPFWHGEATVGLQGSFGSVKLGRQLEAISYNDGTFDPFENFNEVASPAWHFWHFNYSTDRISNAGTPEYGRLNNGIFYDSTNWNGVTVHLSGSFEKSTAAGAGRGKSLSYSLNYDKDGASAMVAGGKNPFGDRVTFFGGKYTFGNLDVMGAYDVSEWKDPATPNKAKAFTLGTSYRMGATTFNASWGRLDSGEAVNPKTSMVGLGAKYDLSKRTNVYAVFGHKKPDGSDAENSYGAGINHNF